MKDYDVSLNKKCPCIQKGCPIRGNCVLCIQNHLEHERHVPECVQNILRENIKNLSKMVEYDSKDTRPSGNFWNEFDKEQFIKDSLKRHKK